MGEYADLILDGEVCQHCGVTLNTPSDGISRSCRDCQREHSRQRYNPFTRCPDCDKKVKRIGLAAHAEAKHGR